MSTPGILAYPPGKEGEEGSDVAAGAAGPSSATAAAKQGAGAGSSASKDAGNAVASSSNANASGPASTRVLLKRSLSSLLLEVDPSEILSPDVEDLLLDLADDFIDSATHFACKVAKHRSNSSASGRGGNAAAGEPKLEAKDVQLVLERMWGIRVPGTGMPLPPVRVRGQGPGQAQGGAQGGMSKAAQTAAAAAQAAAQREG